MRDDGGSGGQDGGGVGMTTEIDAAWEALLNDADVNERRNVARHRPLIEAAVRGEGVTRDELERAFRLVATGNNGEHLTFAQWADALYGALTGRVVTRQDTERPSG